MTFSTPEEYLAAAAAASASMAEATPAPTPAPAPVMTIQDQWNAGIMQTEAAKVAEAPASQPKAPVDINTLPPLYKEGFEQVVKDEQAYKATQEAAAITSRLAGAESFVDPTKGFSWDTIKPDQPGGTYTTINGERYYLPGTPDYERGFRTWNERVEAEKKGAEFGPHAGKEADKLPTAIIRTNVFDETSKSWVEKPLRFYTEGDAFKSLVATARIGSFSDKEWSEKLQSLNTGGISQKQYDAWMQGRMESGNSNALLFGVGGKWLTESQYKFFGGLTGRNLLTGYQALGVVKPDVVYMGNDEKGLPSYMEREDYLNLSLQRALKGQLSSFVDESGKLKLGEAYEAGFRNKDTFVKAGFNVSDEDMGKAKAYSEALQEQRKYKAAYDEVSPFMTFPTPEESMMLGIERPQPTMSYEGIQNALASGVKASSLELLFGRDYVKKATGDIVPDGADPQEQMMWQNIRAGRVIPEGVTGRTENTPGIAFPNLNAYKPSEVSTWTRIASFFTGKPVAGERVILSTVSDKAYGRKEGDPIAARSIAGFLMGLGEKEQGRKDLYTMMAATGHKEFDVPDRMFLPRGVQIVSNIPLVGTVITPAYQWRDLSSEQRKGALVGAGISLGTQLMAFAPGLVRIPAMEGSFGVQTAKGVTNLNKAGVATKQPVAVQTKVFSPAEVQEMQEAINAARAAREPITSGVTNAEVYTAKVKSGEIVPIYDTPWVEENPVPPPRWYQGLKRGSDYGPYATSERPLGTTRMVTQIKAEATLAKTMKGSLKDWVPDISNINIASPPAIVRSVSDLGPGLGTAYGGSPVVIRIQTPVNTVVNTLGKVAYVAAPVGAIAVPLGVGIAPAAATVGVGVVGAVNIVGTSVSSPRLVADETKITQSALQTAVRNHVISQSEYQQIVKQVSETVQKSTTVDQVKKAVDTSLKQTLSASKLASVRSIFEVTRSSTETTPTDTVPSRTTERPTVGTTVTAPTDVPARVTVPTPTETVPTVTSPVEPIPPTDPFVTTKVPPVFLPDMGGWGGGLSGGGGGGRSPGFGKRGRFWLFPGLQVVLPNPWNLSSPYKTQLVSSRARKYGATELKGV